jgi:hypothetical protein
MPRIGLDDLRRKPNEARRRRPVPPRSAERALTPFGRK